MLSWCLDQFPFVCFFFHHIPMIHLNFDSRLLNFHVRGFKYFFCNLFCIIRLPFECFHSNHLLLINWIIYYDKNVKLFFFSLLFLLQFFFSFILFTCSDFHTFDSQKKTVRENVCARENGISWIDHHNAKANRQRIRNEKKRNETNAINNVLVFCKLVQWFV